METQSSDDAADAHRAPRPTGAGASALFGESVGSGALGTSAGDNCLAQLQRTSDWLRSLPLSRLERADGAVANSARELIASVNALVLEICRAVPSSQCPPPDAAPDRLAPHGLGDQLAVHAQDLARCLAAAEVAEEARTPLADESGAALGPTPAGSLAGPTAAGWAHFDAEIAALAAQALSLRQGHS